MNNLQLSVIYVERSANLRYYVFDKRDKLISVELRNVSNNKVPLLHLFQFILLLSLSLSLFLAEATACVIIDHYREKELYRDILFAYFLFRFRNFPRIKGTYCWQNCARQENSYDVINMKSLFTPFFFSPAKENYVPFSRKILWKFNFGSYPFPFLTKLPWMTLIKGIFKNDMNIPHQIISNQRYLFENKNGK